MAETLTRSGDNRVVAEQGDCMQVQLCKVTTGPSGPCFSGGFHNCVKVGSIKCRHGSN